MMKSSVHPLPAPKRLFTTVLLFLFVLLGNLWGQQLVFAGDETLHRLRAERRQKQLEAQLAPAKADGPALFGLLVIPVDFSDTRFPENYDPVQEIGSRLFAESGQSLNHYFSVASGQLLELRITLAPTVHLEKSRREYSDVGYNGFSRTRAMATESLEAVKAGGLEFRSLDMEGPDRVPGSADDDGVVDGVLILHAAMGQENDPENGLIQALQFFLADPVVSGGVQASFYAVASARSGPGIWAHETGHLLGMEDRYDPLLHPVSGGGDVRSLGGLGQFSLMASGAWGTGEGWYPALPDAYTCAQLGWYQWRYLPEAGVSLETLTPRTASRIWTRGGAGPEFFLMEVRDPLANAPFDAGIPPGQMLIYHVDETVPEGSWSDDGNGQWHLRVRVVEADADGMLAAGQDDGRAEDLFPGPLGVFEFSPFSLPSSHGYEGSSDVILADINSADSAVSFTALAATDPAVEFDFSFTGTSSALLELEVRSVGTPLDALQCLLRDDSPEHRGTFAGGLDAVSFELVETEAGIWQPAEDVWYHLEASLEPGLASSFEFTFTDTGLNFQETRPWLWQTLTAPLDFQNNWPGEWTVSQHTTTTTTTWHRWAGPPFLTADQGAVLAATGTTFDTSTYWPDVHYNNKSWIRLHSGLLGQETRYVRVIHALETEVLTGPVAMDGGRLLWENSQGQVVGGTVLDGYQHHVHPGSNNPLAGETVFADSLLHLVDNRPTWAVDIVALPEGPGPWRLNLEFASNSVWRFAGWFVAGLQELTGFQESSSFPIRWDLGTGLTWQWPHPDLEVQDFSIEARQEPGGRWAEIRSGLGEGPVPAEHLTQRLPGGASNRNLVRVVARTDLGRIASRAVVVYPDGGFMAGGQLGAPRPNPTRGQVQFRLEIPAGQEGQVRVFDIRGRLVSSVEYPAGTYLAHWDGLTQDGQRASAGTYFIRLEGSGPVQTRKVVLLH